MARVSTTAACFLVTALVCATGMASGCSLARDFSEFEQDYTVAGTCGEGRWPERDADDDNRPSSQTITLALHEFDFQHPGYDLDSACTHQSGGEQRCQPPRAGPPHHDGPSGRDNQFGLWLAPMLWELDLARDAADQQGIGNLLVEIEYGGDNDSQVRVALGVSTAGTSHDEMQAPEWNGSDVFWGATLANRVGRVTDGVLVAFMGEDPIELPVLPGGAPLTLTDAYLIGNIAGRGLRDPVLVGRWPISAIADVVDALGCFSPQEEASLQLQPEYIADVVGNARANTNCDALSVAIGFDAKNVEWRTSGGASARVPDAISCE